MKRRTASSPPKNKDRETVLSSEIDTYLRNLLLSRRIEGSTMDPVTDDELFRKPLGSGKNNKKNRIEKIGSGCYPLGRNTLEQMFA
jgi:hypothetical protein